MLSSGSAISSVAHQLSCFGFGFSLYLITRSCFFTSRSFSGARSVICQLALCGQHVVMVCWLFFSFAVSFDFGCCSLAEMIFVDHYLPYFRQQLITHPLSALLPFQLLFTESSYGDQLLAPPPFSCAFSATPPICCVLLFNSLFFVHFFFLGRGGDQSAQGLCWFILGVVGGIPRDPWCSPV
jgi:hypothetical protein